MSERTSTGLAILAVALGVGVLGDGLLRALPWGINVTVCSIVLIGGAVGIVRARRLPTTREAPWLAITALLLAVAFVRRDSRPLAALDLLGLILALALGALSLQGVRVRVRGVTAYALAAPVAAITAAIGVLPLVLGDIRWAEVPRPARLGQLRAVALGALLAVPLLGVFTALFASADATFALATREAFHFDAASLASHAFLILFWGALTAGFLRGALLGRSDWALTGERLTPGSPGGGIPFATAATALGLVNLLFVVFLGLQASYLFGGAGYVQRATGLTIAEYARHGFFELVTASGLVLPLLLGADWATRRETAQQRTSFRALLGLTVMLVAVMLASALQRMFLYVGAFGLTELRVYTTGFMMWLAGVFGWFAWTVLRARRASFAFGALVQGWIVLAGLHVLNPDAFIARTNLARAVAGQPIGEGGDTARGGGGVGGARNTPDVRYLAWNLSADAVPELVATLPRLSPQDQRVVSEALVRRWADSPARDWRSWNWSASRAASLVRERQAGLRVIFQP
jgi:uncharacterized protein DUF4153